MKLSTRSTYGLRALTCLAEQFPDGLSLGEIAENEKISLKYLEAIFAILKKEGLVTSTKGAGGGYKLAKDPSQITVWEALRPLEKTLPEGSCLGSGGKKNYCKPGCCAVGTMLAEVQKSVQSKLEQYTLSDLLKNEK